MYRLVIADDEYVIRNGLTELIDWQSLGFEMVACFKDGKEIIEYIKDNPVNVVLADIKMAEVSGLEVAKYIYINKLHIKTVIISGYKEFEYARKAVEYNVEHYLLKPSDFDEIYRVFRELKKKLDSESEKESKEQRDMVIFNELIPIMREQLFTDITMGAIKSRSEIENRMKLLDLNVKALDNPCCIIRLRIEDYERYLKQDWYYESERLKVAVFNFFKEKEEFQYFCINFTRDDLKIIAISNSISDQKIIYENVNGFINDVKKSVFELLKLKVQVNIEKVYSKLLDISEDIQPFKTFSEKADLTHQNLKEILDTEEYKRLISKFRMFMSSINDGDLDNVEGLLDNYIQEISTMPVKYIHYMIIELLMMLTNNLQELGIDIRHITWEKYNFLTVTQMKSIEEIKKWTSNVLKDIFELRKAHSKSSSEMLINKAIDYIRSHIDKDITLEEVSDHVFFNQVYFSRFFKQQTGENFIDYIIRTRMEKAIELMSSKSYKAYEISNMVGYNSSKYFSRVFKQYTGYTVKDYCRMVLKQNNT